MAVTYELSGQHSLTAFFQATASGDRTGAEKVSLSQSITFNDAGGSEPDLQVFLNGTGTVSNGSPITILLAAASDPLAGSGDAGYYPPDQTGASKKLKYIRIRNTTAAGGGTLQVEGATGNVCPVFDAAGDSITIRPQGHFELYQYDGLAAMTSLANDGLTLTSSSGAVTYSITVAYGS